MDTYKHSLAPRFANMLVEREARLRAILHDTGELASQVPQVRDHEVQDFKDIAVSETQAVVDEAQAEHAVHELEQVLAARRRINDQSYGMCLDCGEPIDLRRLMAMPSTPFCTACQSIHEHERPLLARRSTAHGTKGRFT